MRRWLAVLAAHPGVTVQDRGRPGLLASGVSRGGAADPLALDEAAAVLGQQVTEAVEMAAQGGRFRVEGGAAVIALTGAPMQAEIEGARLAWPGTHSLPEGATLSVGPAIAGTYGYLALDGGIATEPLLGARSAHLAAGIGGPIAAGDRLPLGEGRGARAGLTLDAADRFSGGTLRLLPSAQTDAFPADQIARLESEIFTKDRRANRQGARLVPEGAGFAAEGGLSVTSEAIVPGDIQIVGGGGGGGGQPFVLLAECQTTGGYPRIATVISADLPRVAQAPPGTAFRLRFVALEEALAARRAARDHGALSRAVRPLVRDPADIPDLLAYRLIDGVTSGDDPDHAPDDGGTT
jgi:allophanate hydrolase